uniref:Phage derived protein Gp49-like (DUF891) n=1 Tax=Candidatus Kentrum sp. UNK TaxID=2126344 RepID=A0A451AI56_9GAMM|nr:MAG: Phage derived protein Gp49-like (DUF891) [Candidatus Kentron sp. UNK]VFK71546.1 MAG: Phage derived protein Gp49-like (DUF891) [Candidatus Kentron sp. UNK]
MHCPRSRLRRLSGCSSWLRRSIPFRDRYFRKLAGSDGIWEIRIDAGNNTFRTLGFLDGKELVVLNHAFQKKARKTSSKEIHLAENRKWDYLARKKSS